VRVPLPFPTTIFRLFVWPLCFDSTARFSIQPVSFLKEVFPSAQFPTVLAVFCCAFSAVLVRLPDFTAPPPYPELFLERAWLSSPRHFTTSFHPVEAHTASFDSYDDLFLEVVLSRLRLSLSFPVTFLALNFLLPHLAGTLSARPNPPSSRPSRCNFPLILESHSARDKTSPRWLRCFARRLSC